MELGGHQLAALDRAGELVAVIGGGEHIVPVLGLGMVGVDEIEFFVPVQPVEERRGLATLDPVPTDVRHGQVTAEAAHRARQDAEPRLFRGLLAGREQGLEGDADTEERLARVQVADERITQLPFPQGAHERAEVADPGEDEPLGAVDVRTAVHHRHGFAEPFDGVDDRADVARAVIEEGDHGFFRPGACREGREPVQGQARRPCAAGGQGLAPSAGKALIRAVSGPRQDQSPADFPMQAILLAAGYGTRLRPYTHIRPKPLFPVANRPLLDRLLDQLHAAFAAPVLVNCHHLADQIEAALGARPEVLVQREAEILGTGGSLRLAIDRLDNDPVLVINGDLFHDIDLERVYHHHLRSGFDVTMALHDCPRFNTVRVADGRVLGFDEGDGERLAFTGIHVIDPDAIERIPRQGFFHIIDLYRELAAAGRIGCCRVDGNLWRDIGTPADYLDLHRELLAERGWLIDPTARVAADAVLEGWGCIGAGARVGAGVQLRDSVVWDSAAVVDNTVCTGRILTGDPAVDTGLGQRGTDE